MSSSRALGLGVEGADRFQAVAEEVEPDRLVEAGRKQVEDAAAHGIFAGLAHGRGAVVAVVLEPGDDGVHRRPRCRARPTAPAPRRARAPARAARRLHRRQHDQRLVAAGERREPRQRGQALRQDAAMGRDAVIGLAVPGRELSTGKSGAKNCSARSSCCMRGPSRQTTARLTAGFFGRAAMARARSEMTRPSAPSATLASVSARPGVSSSAGDYERRFHRFAVRDRKRLDRANSAPVTSAGSTLSPVMAA